MEMPTTKDLESLPVTDKAAVPEEWLDSMGHMNVRGTEKFSGHKTRGLAYNLCVFDNFSSNRSDERKEMPETWRTQYRAAIYTESNSAVSAEIPTLYTEPRDTFEQADFDLDKVVNSLKELILIGGHVQVRTGRNRWSRYQAKQNAG